MTAVTTEGAEPTYRDAGRAVDERVDDLLARMTVAEKVAQLGSTWVFQLVVDGHLSTADARTLLANGIGHVTRVSGASNLGPDDAAAAANDIQQFLVDETRLGIPAIIHEEVCSGFMSRRATVFPQAIGVASTWDLELVEQMGGVIRREMRAVGAHQGLAPVLDVCRDPRWGRTEETFGEDPHLVASLGMSLVRGLQGTDLTEGVVATAKHFVGYGASEGGLNWAPAHIPPRELHDVYLHPFEAAVRMAGLRSVMNGYHELDGVPCAADRELLTDVLRATWGFEGCVVSDYFAIRQLAGYHHHAADAAGAAVAALTAGVDVELPGTDCYGKPLLEALEANAVDDEVLDTAVRRVLRTKFELGLFDRPLVDVGAASAVVGAPAHRELAAIIARKSIVLLSNDGTLPLPADPGTVAVIGPNADVARNLFGDYSYPAHVESLLEMRHRENVFSVPLNDDVDLDAGTLAATTVYEELRDRLGASVRLAAGCEVNGTSKAGFDEAVVLAQESDVAVLVMGDKAGLTDDCTSGEGRDRTSLDLPGVQEDLVRAVVATGTPVVLVIVGGRPGGSVWVHENCAAVVMAWLPGREGAAAIADVLSGTVNASGKLPISFPRNTGQIPVYYGHKVSGGRSHWKGDYIDSPAGPLYPFGHGLSYTTFQLTGAAVEQTEATADGSVTVTVQVANTGDRDGDEVVQLYVRDPVAAVTRPVLELKGFARVTVAAGASKQVTFTLPVAQLGFHDRELRYAVEPGEIEVFVGPSSRELQSAGSFTVVTDASARDGTKAFSGSVVVV
jgi:beta-glucosidase